MCLCLKFPLLCFCSEGDHRSFLKARFAFSFLFGLIVFVLLVVVRIGKVWKPWATNSAFLFHFSRRQRQGTVCFFFTLWVSLSDSALAHSCACIAWVCKPKSFHIPGMMDSRTGRNPPSLMHFRPARPWITVLETCGGRSVVSNQKCASMFYKFLPLAKIFAHSESCESFCP